MFYNLLTKEVEDFTGKGLNDLRDGIIRTPLEPIQVKNIISRSKSAENKYNWLFFILFQTFIDDPLRVLRTFRFATKLEFSVIP